MYHYLTANVSNNQWVDQTQILRFVVQYMYMCGGQYAVLGIDKVCQHNFQNNRYVDSVVEKQVGIWEICNYELSTSLKIA